VIHNNAEALQTLHQPLGFHLALNADHRCPLLMDDEVVIQFRGAPEATQLELSGPVGPLADPDSPAVLRALLQANFEGLCTGPAALSMDDETLEIFLRQVVDVLALGPEGLAPVLFQFASLLNFWRGSLPQLEGAGGPQSSSLDAAQVDLTFESRRA
jgi:hypothetical protein